MHTTKRARAADAKALLTRPCLALIIAAVCTAVLLTVFVLASVAAKGTQQSGVGPQLVALDRAPGADGGNFTNVFKGMLVSPLVPRPGNANPAVDLDRLFRDSVVLVVNVASNCGYTLDNYRQLQAMYAELGGRGFTVLAFPCNQFWSQENDAPSVIEHFARATQHATFPLFEKVDVNGPATHPLYRRLKRELAVETVDWNFNKFLVDRGGRAVRHYNTRVPFPIIRSHVERLLERK
jgi:glutathione peroxidase